MKDTLSQRAYIDWQLYWVEEPWGPFRDNLHTAMTIREIRRSWIANKQAELPIEQWMVKSQERVDELAEQQRRQNNANLVTALRARATRKKVKHGDDRPRKTGGAARSPDRPIFRRARKS